MTEALLKEQEKCKETEAKMEDGSQVVPFPSDEGFLQPEMCACSLQGWNRGQWDPITVQW